VVHISALLFYFLWDFQHIVRFTYQPPASSIFLSEQTSHHQPANNQPTVLFSQNKSAPATSQTNRLQVWVGFDARL
jgi:hypothetical protein